MTQRRIPSRVDRLDARRHARFAREHGQPATVCPYDPESPDPWVRVLAVTWVREYRRGQTPAVSVDDEPEA